MSVKLFRLSLSLLVKSALLSVGVKVPVQVLLSLSLVISPKSTLECEMSAALKEKTSSEKTSDTVALSPGLSAGNSILLALVKIVP